jgi:hypothetical protein
MSRAPGSRGGTLTHPAKAINAIIDGIQVLIMCSWGISYEGNLDSNSKTCECDKLPHPCTKKRLELIRYVAAYEELNTRQLAQALSRDYKNVYEDVPS